MRSDLKSHQQTHTEMKSYHGKLVLFTISISRYIAASEPTCSPPDGVDFYWTTCGHPKTGLGNVWFGISKSKYNWEGGKQLCDLAASRSNYTTGLTASYDVEWDFCSYHAVRMLTGDSHSVDVLLPGKWIRDESLQNSTTEEVIYPDGWSWCTEDTTAVGNDCTDQRWHKGNFEKLSLFGSYLCAEFPIFVRLSLFKFRQKPLNFV